MHGVRQCSDKLLGRGQLRTMPFWMVVRPVFPCFFARRLATQIPNIAAKYKPQKAIIGTYQTCEGREGVSSVR